VTDELNIPFNTGQTFKVILEAFQNQFDILTYLIDFVSNRMNLDYVYGTDLDEIGKFFEVIRYSDENDVVYRSRISNWTYYGQNATTLGLIQSLGSDILGYIPTIDETNGVSINFSSADVSSQPDNVDKFAHLVLLFRASGIPYFVGITEDQLVELLTSYSDENILDVLVNLDDLENSFIESVLLNTLISTSENFNSQNDVFNFNIPLINIPETIFATIQVVLESEVVAHFIDEYNIINIVDPTQLVPIVNISEPVYLYGWGISRWGIDHWGPLDLILPLMFTRPLSEDITTITSDNINIADLLFDDSVLSILDSTPLLDVLNNLIENLTPTMILEFVSFLYQSESILVSPVSFTYTQTTPFRIGSGKIGGNNTIGIVNTVIMTDGLN